MTLRGENKDELFYDSRFDAWSRTEWIGGASFPLNRRVDRFREMSLKTSLQRVLSVVLSTAPTTAS